jgi:glycosyltransferase involved in cell wall biosynthesis
VVICPIRIGTGIKVKLLEALSFGKVCVATEAAAEGLEPYAGKYFLIGKDAKDTLEKISSLFNDRERYEKIKSALPAFCREYNHSSQFRELYKAIRQGVKDRAVVE